MRKLEPGKNNSEEKMNFVEYWANYVKTHSDRDWSKQQNPLINSQIQNARKTNLSAKEYLRIKHSTT